MDTMKKNGASGLPLLTKISYGCIGTANMLTSAITTTYLLYFYTNALGLSGALAGTLSLIGSAWGWFCTPAAGAIIDKTGSKPGGKCRNYIKKLIVPGGVLLFLSFTVPELSQGLTVVWVMAAYLIRVSVWSLLQVCGTTLMGRVTSDRVQRSHLNQIYNAMATAGSFLGTAVTMPLINSFGSDLAGTKQGFMVISIIFGVAFIVLYLIAWLGTRGYEPETEFFESDTQGETGTTLEKKPSVLDILKALVTNKMCLVAIGLYMVDLIGCMVESSAMAYYFQYNLSNMGLFTLYSTLSIIGAYSAYFLAGFFVKRFGNSGTAMIGGTIAACAYLVRFLAQDSSMVQYVACVMVALFGAGLVANVSILCVFDSKIYGEWKLGINNEGMLMAAYSLGNTIGLAVGRAAAGYLLELVPFDPTAAEAAPSVLRLFLIESTLVPCIGFVCVVLMALLLRRFEKKLPEMEEEIAARKAL